MAIRSQHLKANGLAILIDIRIEKLTVLSAQQVILDLEILLMTGKSFSFLLLFAFAVGGLFRFVPCGVSFAQETNYDTYEKQKEKQIIILV